MLTMKRALGLVEAEMRHARLKHSQKNLKHTLDGWKTAICKQLGDLDTKNPRDRLAVRKELTQIAAAATLAIAHLDPEGDDREEA